MLRTRYRSSILILALVMLEGTVLLVINEARTPGFCPTYPVLGVPACWVVLVYFATMTVALFVAGAAGATLFFVAGALAISTGLFFSTLEILTPGQQCPQLFGIPLPLCFTVPPMTGLMLWLGWRGRAD